MAFASIERGFEHIDLVGALQFGLGVGEPRFGFGTRTFAAATEASCSELSSVKIGSPCLT